DELMTWRTCDAAESCSKAPSSRSRLRRAVSVSWVAVERRPDTTLGGMARFGISALRRCGLACLLLALERRRLCFPKAGQSGAAHVRLGQKRTFGPRNAMSALPPKADQKQTFCAAAKMMLFDYLVGAGK